MTRFERARRGVIARYKRLLDGWLLNKRVSPVSCGWCWEYQQVLWDCSSCPIYKIEGENCLGLEWYVTMEGARYYSPGWGFNPNEPIWLIMARLTWLHTIREEDIPDDN